MFYQTSFRRDFQLSFSTANAGNVLEFLRNFPGHFSDIHRVREKRGHSIIGITLANVDAAS